MGGIAARDWSLFFLDLEFLSSLPQSVLLEVARHLALSRPRERHRVEL
ncbi:hypothetical protein SAMN04488030_0186 [Aliiroseovarius halocynthiae]|nr:hypothetical protein SAMN04488030_0186 [Aliiroseovarius halocynthiae]